MTPDALPATAPSAAQPPTEDPPAAHSPAWLAARRLALGHVLALVSDSECGDSLVLRGSATLRAWLGAAAREPGDLDWVVRPLAGVPLDDLYPHPYLRNRDPVRLWPEVVHGAGRSEMWELEDLDTGGLRAHVPPDGLSWVEGEEFAALDPVHRQVTDLIRRSPRAGGDVVLAADEADYATLGDYYGDGYAFGTGPGLGGVRIVVPWTAPGLEPGWVQLDFAYDERLPEAAVLTAIPRMGARRPVAAWTASRELSLAWKLKWLATDEICAWKDLYDAVLLAELGGMRLGRRLRALLPERRLPTPAEIRAWSADDPALLDRLAESVTRLG